YLQAITDTDVTVSWITHTNCWGWVEYGEDQTQLNNKATQTENGMTHLGTIHRVKLTGLTPGKTYYYRVVAEPVTHVERKNTVFGTPQESAVHPVSTTFTRAEEISFVVFNDLHEQPESFGLLRALQPDVNPDFMVLNGDMVSSLRSEDQFVEHVLAPLTSIGASSTPVLYARGNHETWGMHARKITDYIGGFPHPFYYGVAYGPVYLIVLDSGEARTDDDPANAGLIAFDAYREQQAEWLAKEVKKEA